MARKARLVACHSLYSNVNVSSLRGSAFYTAAAVEELSLMIDVTTGFCNQRLTER